MMVRIISALLLAVTASLTFAQEPLRLADNPPDRHIVVRGDTLWGIAGKFLKQPWRWPEIWRLNKEQIRNPHLIYPGDIVLLDRSGGSPRLTIARPVVQRPAVISEPIPDAIPSIPPNVIEPFISQPLVIEANGHDQAPRVVATQEDRVFVGASDTAFVSGISGVDTINWHIYRPGKPLKDPVSGEVLGHEAFFLGSARLIRPGEPATVEITAAREEIGRGDRLVPAPAPKLLSYMPHKPDNPVDARVLAIYGGVNEAGKHAIVSLSRGSRDGLEIGHVVALFRNRVSQGYDEEGRRVNTTIPEERYALAFVFRVFDRVAYALVMESTKSVIVGDSARNP